MRAVIQRVLSASVIIEKNVYSQINNGLLVLLGISPEDTDNDIEWLANKIINLRIFNDSNNLMNLSLIDIAGEILIVSQFTLHAYTKKGNRPSYTKAAKPEIAIPLYNKFVEYCQSILKEKVKTGLFGAMMQINLINDGPVTIIIDTKNKDL